jgi:8-oxo-dGTP pyrophosphatase MutT (NUDIX family)
LPPGFEWDRKSLKIIPFSQANEMIWKPHVTVAAVIEQDGRFLLVEEHTDNGPQFNQPAGHWEPEETLVQGAVREVLEETAYHFVPESLLGIYRWRHPSKDVTYLRFAFAGRAGGHEPERALDTGIIRAAWLTLDEIRATAGRHRSPLILRCVEDYLAGKRYPLDVITHFHE